MDTGTVTTSDLYNLSAYSSSAMRNGPPSPIYPQSVRRSRQAAATSASNCESPLSPSAGFFRQRTETVSSTASRQQRDRDGSSSPSPPPRFTNSDTDRTRRRRKHKRSATLSPTGRMRSRESRNSWSKANRESDLLLSPTDNRSYERRLSVRSISPACTNLASPSGFPAIKKRPELPNCVRASGKRAKLRKTFSEPSEIFVDECDTQKVERIQDILSSLNFRKFQTNSSAYAMPSSSYSLVNSNSGSFITGRSSPNHSATCLDEVWSTPHGSFLLLTKGGEKPKVLHRNASGQTIILDDSESDIIATDIEELKEAAQSIELLSRRSRRKPPTPPSIDPLAPVDGSVMCTQSAGLLSSGSVPPIMIPGPSSAPPAPDSATLPRRSGITTRLGGHPRGVMQFLPSVKSSEFLSKTAYETYIANKNRREQMATQSEESDTCSPPNSHHMRQSSTDIYDVQGYMRKHSAPTYVQSQTLRRKTSVPDQFYSMVGCSGYEMDLSMCDSDSTEPSGLTMPTLPLNVEEMKTFSDEEWIPNSLASTQTLIIPQTSSYKPKTGRRTRKVSAPMMDDRLSRLGRFASFAATGMRPNDAARGLGGSSRKINRQYSTHASSDTESNAQSVFPIKGAESLAGFSRFGRLLKSLRASRQNSPETDNALSPASSESPLSSPSAHERYGHKMDNLCVAGSSLNTSRSWHERGHVAQHKALSHCVTSDSDSSMLQADIMLWRKRSRASLRKHESSNYLDLPEPVEVMAGNSFHSSPIRLRRKFSLNNAFSSSEKSSDHSFSDSNNQSPVSPPLPLTPNSARAGTTPRQRRSSSRSGLFRFFTVPEDSHNIDVDDGPFTPPSVSPRPEEKKKFSKKEKMLHANRHSFCTVPCASMDSTTTLEWAPVDTRTHIVKELFDTESSYIENLQLMVHKYLRPLKRPELCSLVDSSLVDEIFFQIPEILGHHELFYAALKCRLENWNTRQKIGDIILNNFTKQSVIDTYTAFINNWKHAKRAIRTASQTKSAFAKYLERCSREHRSKLTLDALLIMPVQRIPRYELLIRELLKHTSVEHPDHPVLVRSQKEIHDLAIKINHVEQEAGLCEQMQQRLREIEAIVDGLDDLVSPERIFFRYDLVHVEAAGGKKERCMFLFSDQLIITNVKRKSSNALRKNAVNAPHAHNFLENNKFKLLMKISLDDLEITKHALPALTKIQDDVSNLSEDLRVLGKITELTSLLKVNRESVETEIDQLKDGIRERLTEKQVEMTTNPLLTSMELMVTTEDGIEAFNVSFPNADRRVAWEKCFNDAKETLTLSLSKRPPPIFLKPLVIQKTRAGLHFTCTSATLGLNEHGYPDVWVCNSDGYIGQVGVLSLTPEPDLSSCIGIANSKIICICSVPMAKCTNRKSRKISSTLTVTEVATGSNLQLNSDSSDNDDSTDATETKSLNGSPDSHKSSSTISSVSNSKANRKESCTEDNAATMWLGTEDGSIQIYNYNDNVRTRKNKAKVQHQSSINSLVNVDDRIFAALGGGELIYYQRAPDGTWCLDTSVTVALEIPVLCPITSMLLVTGRLWCALQNYILIVNPITLQLEHSFLSTTDRDCPVSCMSTGGLGVWLAVKGSSLLKLFHALTYECLLEVNLTPTVTKALAGCDDIIRQHKLSCLRITALLCCKDLLWAGTSAGVILQLPLPHIAHNSQRLTSTPAISVSPVGHSGPCRFVASVDLHSGCLSRSGSHSGPPGPSGAQWDLSKRRMSLNVAALQQGKVYVISGGDGFEDLQDNNTDDADESIGKQDSTNYLLIWQV